jgi:putative oxidoreductase
MATLEKMFAPDMLAARILSPLQPLFALGARLYVSWQFLKSGYLKLTTWDTTLYLFENEYHTPLLSPHVAAVAGTFGELFFPTLLVVGFMSRLSAIGLFAVNAMAVLSYAQVLLAEGSEAALGQHVLWGSLLLFLIIYGPGKLSLDYLLGRSRFDARSR